MTNGQTSRMIKPTPHEEYAAACLKVDKHLEICAYCDDFRGENKCEEVEKLLDLVGEACGRVDLANRIDQVDKHLETCAYCGDNKCEEAEKLLDLVGESRDRRNKSIQSNKHV